MNLTTGEKRLLILYHSGSVRDTAAVVRDALPDITAPDEQSGAVTLLRKLEDMSNSEFDSFDPESGVIL